MTPFLWAMLLLVVALALMVLELFVPSGGLLGFLSMSSIIASVVMVYVERGNGPGTLYLACLAVLIPTLMVAGLKWWPHTPVGRRILNVAPGAAGVESALPSYESLKNLVGQRGQATSKMLPGGMIEIEGKTYDAVTNGVAVDPGQTVEVTAVDGNRITVRAISAAEATATASDDVLSQPISEIISDAFDEPLT